MLRVVLAAVVVAAVVVADDAPAGLRALFEPRLMASGIRQVRLERQVRAVRDELHEALKVDPAGFLADLNERIDHVEAKKGNCDNKQHDLKCGRNSLECVSSLLLCDGHNDCHNGWDESEKTCSAGPAVSGAEFVGTATWVSCANHDDHPVKLTITGTYKPDFFHARIGVRAHVTTDFTDPHDKSHKEIDFRGMYVLGKKRLTLFPVSSVAKKEHLGIMCDFVHGNDDSAECIFTHEGSLVTCAKIHITRQH